MSIDLESVFEGVATLASLEDVVSIEVEHHTSKLVCFTPRKEKKKSYAVLGFLACRVAAGRP